MQNRKLTINKPCFALLLVLALLAGLLAGCGKGGGGGNAAFTEKQTPEAMAVQVATMDELMNAIKPGAVIFVKNGDYNFQEWLKTVDADKWNTTNQYVYLEFATTSFQAIIHGVDHLSITGETTSGVKLVNEDTYADVLNFDDCHSISLDHMTMGHGEAGDCTGDVLEFYNCTDVSLDTMDLYGCGTYGVNASYCHGINISGTTIRECSYGIISIGNSTDVNFRNCELKDCTGYYQLESWNSELLFESCNFSGNGKGDDCEFIADDSNKSIYFKGCSFSEWESEQLTNMENGGCVVCDENCKFKGSDGRKPVIVKTAEDLVNAIDQGAMIILEPGTYNLSEYIEGVDMSSFNDSHSFVQITDYFDGRGIEIYGDNISFTGRTGKAKDTTILLEPRYAHCFSMDGTYGTFFRGLTVGHTQTGDCDGAVMQLSNSVGSVFADCDLYGCGTVGIQSYGGDDIYVMNSNIHDCSFASFVLSEGNGTFVGSNTIFDGNGCSIYDCDDMYITFDRCKFGEWESNYLYFDDSIDAYDCEWHEITYYPEYSDDGYFGDFRDNLSPQRFDQYVIMGTWQGIQYYDSNEDLDLSLPAEDENGDPFALTLFIYDDGTADLFNAVDAEPVNFEWYMDSDYSAAIVSEGEIIGSFGVSAAPEDEADVPIFLTMNIDGTTVWFDPVPLDP
jgi:hypothetical protein